MLVWLVPGSFEVGYVAEDGSAHRVALTDAWAVPEMLRHCQRTCSHTPPGLGPSLLDAASRSACAAAIRLAASCPAYLTAVLRSVSATARAV